MIGRAREVRVEAQYPDDFVMHLLDLAPNLVFSGTKRQGESLKNPPLGVEQYLESLERQGLAQTSPLSDRSWN